MARELAARGVEYLFGLPGGEIVAFIDACRREGIRFLLTGHEASAAWMAQVTGQITGVPGVCAATLGPGATNLVTGVANAFLDRAPMLAVTAQIPKAALSTMTHQRLALDQLFAPITKASVAIGDSGTGGVLRDAMDLAAAPRPGPVHVSLASDLATEEAVPSPASPAPIPSNVPDLTGIERRINASTRPLALVGLGATPADAPAIRALIDRWQAPFLVTPKAKGIVSEDHPRFLGVASGMAIDRDILETIRSADLVLAIGFDPVECDKTWFAKTEIIAIDDASMSAGDYHPVEVIGDVSSIVDALNVGPKPWPAELIAQRRDAIRREPKTESSPLRLISELRSILPRETMVTCDVGSHKLVMGQFWRAFEPGTFFMSNGLSGMGFGLPAAIAAQLARPETPVLSVVGDGGMLLMIHDLALIRELNLPIVMVVCTDRSLSLIRVSEHRRGIAPYGVDFAPPDFAAIAQAFGIGSRKVRGVDEIKPYIDRARSERVPFLIDVPIDYTEYYDLV